MQDREKVIELLKTYRTAMLVTHDGGRLQGRPMEIARVDDDGTLWFFTDKRSRKADDLRGNADVLVALQDEHSSYLSLSGMARLSDDRARARELWSEPFKVWFPEGADDPNLVLVVVTPREAEYWDNRGVQKLKYMFEAATAYLRGERPRVDEGEQHGRTTL